MSNREDDVVQLTKQDLKSTIEKAWNHAIQLSIDPSHTDAGILHTNRSETWVDCLAKGLQTEYTDQKGYRVFWLGRHDEQFKRTEFLFDVLVARVGEVKSFFRSESIYLGYIKACEWAVESELDTNSTRKIIDDMNKLVCAASKKKLFVASHRTGDVTNQDILEQFRPIAENCSGELYFCFIEHPRDWKNAPNPPSLYEWKKDDGWTTL